MNIYFPGLNGIRAIAALIVVFFHINSSMWSYGSTPIYYIETKIEMSTHAVVLFFVLSGYLITYLLMKEKQAFEKIDFKKFYIRRILRIWPIYYLAIIAALVLAPYFIAHEIYTKNLSYCIETVALYTVFIPNFAMLSGFVLPTIVPLWSVGVEEQFYAFWPLCMHYFRNIFRFLVLFVIGYVLIKVILLVSGQVYSTFADHFIYYSYDTMAIGGIGAMLYSKKHRALRFLYHPLVQALCWGFFIGSCILGPLNAHYIINKEMYALVFMIMIVNVSTNPSTLVKLNGWLFNYLGRISYGIYVFHPFVIALTAIPLRGWISGMGSKPVQFLTIGIIVTVLTVLVAALSFRYFESYFLRRKQKFMKVRSSAYSSQTTELVVSRE